MKVPVCAELIEIASISHVSSSVKVNKSMHDILPMPTKLNTLHVSVSVNVPGDFTKLPFVLAEVDILPFIVIFFWKRLNPF